MNKCFIYSGHLRTWSQNRQNHRETLGTGTEVHYSDLDHEPDFYNGYEWEHYRENKIPETTPNSTVNQWHNMFMAFAMAKKGFDVYIRMRYDIKLSGSVPFENYELNDNVVYIPKGHDYHNGVCDMMAFGNYEAMRKYYNVYLLHPLLFHLGKMFHTECYVKWSLEHQGVEVRRLDIESQIIR